ncbi:MAG: ComEA family DNA-binding protein [Balneolaceae bacterium]
MKRKLYFFLERLQISKQERMAIGFLAVGVVGISMMNVMIEQKPVYDPEYYAELEQMFEERSRVLEEEREEILARYDGRPVEIRSEISSPDSDTLHPNSSDSLSLNREKSNGRLININTAGRESLQELPGIGPAYAERILDWRNKNGPFTSVGQLLEIRGIGEKRLERITPLITLE